MIRLQISPRLETCRQTADMHTVKLTRKILVVLALLLSLPVWGPALRADEVQDDAPLTGPTADIIGKFLQATQSHEDALRGVSMEVNIDASIVKLKESGKLQALRKISKVGQITYHVLGFQGNNTVKNDVIARYLQAEQQGQGDQKIAITPENYKFKYRGKKDGANGQAFVFQLSPRKKKVGLFRGEVWLDAATYLPVMERGKLVKNPSIWFKKVEFERDFSIRDGVAIPDRMTSTIDIRVIGTVNLNVSYSKFEQNADSEQPDHPEALVLTGASSN